MSMRRAFGLLLVAHGLLGSAGAAYANKSNDFELAAATPTIGKVGGVNARVQLAAHGDFRKLYVVFRQEVTSSAREQAKVSLRGAIPFAADGRASSALILQLARQVPKQVVVVEALVLAGTGRVVQVAKAQLYFIVDRGRFRRVTFAEAYLPRNVRDSRQMAGGEFDLAVRKSARVSASGTSILTFGSVPPAGAVADLRATLAEAGRVELPAAVGRHIVDPRAVIGIPRRAYTAGGDAQSFIVTGKFGYIGRDDMTHPAPNWVVRLTWLDDDGDTHELALANVEADGSWQAIFSALGYSGQNLFVQYSPQSRFLKIVSDSGKEYWWHSDRRFGIPHTYFFGDEAADTSGAGWLLGLGDAYQDAMVFWDRFYRAGIDAAGDDPLELHFPNISETCGTSASMPWSCADPDGNVYLRAEDADTHTVQHELAHQLNYLFWLPGATKADHNLSDCAGGPETALVEGFADAVPFWVAGNLASAMPIVNGGPVDLEVPGSLCTGDWNELHVAATFWDLADTHADGADTYAMTPSVLPFFVYLWTGDKHSLRFYVDEHASYALPGDADSVRNVYRNNQIIP